MVRPVPFARRLLGAALLTAWAAAAAVAHYEIASHSCDPWGRPWPGGTEAARADLVTPWSRVTGVLPIDRVLHEGREAVVFYRALLGA